MRSSVSTNEVKASKSFTFWNDFICDVFDPLESRSLSNSFFWGGVDFFALDRVGFATVASSPVEVTRSKRNIAQTTQGFFKVSFQIEGESLLEQNGRATHLQPGDWAIYDCTQTYKLTLPQAYKQLVLKIPHDQLCQQVPLAEELTAQKINVADGIGAVTRDLVLNTNNAYGGLQAQSHQQLSTSIFNLIVESINSSFLNLESNQDNGTLWRFKIKRFIDKNCHDSSLTVDTIAQQFNFSKRYLHTLFQDEALSISKYVHQKRLASAERLLTEPRLAYQSITEIALSCGFKNSTHFGRAFKQRYGVTPSEFRLASKSV